MTDETIYCVGDRTRTLVNETEALCVKGLVQRLGRRRRGITIINLLIDVSGSMGQEAIDLLFPSGITKVLGQIIKNANLLMLQAVVRVCVFSTEVREVIPWMCAEDALEIAEGLSERSFGITRLDLAVEDGMGSVGAMKLAIDEARARGTLMGVRKGSVMLVFTDGRITDDSGHRVPFPETLAKRVAKAQEERQMSFVAVGVGDSDAAQLAAMAPPSMRGGRRISHAIKYVGDPDALDWETVCAFIAEGSSNPEGEFRREEAVVNHGGFELVFD